MPLGTPISANFIFVMKISAYLFTLLLGFTTIQPLWNLPEKPAASHSCCQKDTGKQSAQSEKKQRGCDGMSCNPFMGCPMVSYDLAERFTLDYQLPVPTRQVYLVKNDNRLVTQMSDCWHPPQLV